METLEITPTVSLPMPLHYTVLYIPDEFDILNNWVDTAYINWIMKLLKGNITYLLQTTTGALSLCNFVFIRIPDY